MRTNAIASFSMTEDEYVDDLMGIGSPGRCIECKAAIDGIEPDARRYRCEECGETGVYGLEELLMMGMIRFI